MLLLVAVAAALWMAWSIGTNDSANSLGVAVGSRALAIRRAAMIGSLGCLIGALTLSDPVTKTIGKGIVDPIYLSISAGVIVLLTASIVLTLASLRGLPLSTTQVLIGAVIGYGVATAAPLNWSVISEIVAFWVLAPLAALVCGMVCWSVVRRALGRVRGMLQREHIERLFARLQLFSVSALAIAFGANSIPNAIGIFSGLEIRFDVLLVLASAAFALGIFALGPRVIETLGRRIINVELSTAHGFVIQVIAGTLVLVLTFLGIPISTTHVMVSVIIGTGLVGGFARVNWSITSSIAASWVFSIPLAACAGFVISAALSALL